MTQPFKHLKYTPSYEQLLSVKGIGEILAQTIVLKTADTTQKNTGMRLMPQVWGGVYLAERDEKKSCRKLSKVVVGGVLSLDKSLLMGDFRFG